MPASNSPHVYANPDGMRLGACQYCGHCERFICEANAKASPEVLLYPMLKRSKNFEIRPYSHVTGLDYDRQARRVTGVRYVDLLDRRGDRAAGRRRGAVGIHVDQHQAAAARAASATPYDPATRRGVVGKNFCHQTIVRASRVLQGPLDQPVPGDGLLADDHRRVQRRQLRPRGLGFLGGGYIFNNTTNGRPITHAASAARHAALGHEVEAGERRLVRARVQRYGTIGSCYPHVENYLSLDPTYRDAYGQPLLRMTFDWRDNEVKMSDYVTRKAAEIANAIGADIVGPAAAAQGAVRRARLPDHARHRRHAHGRGPATSVVSPHLQHWDAHNLFVVGASVYAHNAGYNPTALLGAWRCGSATTCSATPKVHNVSERTNFMLQIPASVKVAACVLLAARCFDAIAARAVRRW